METIKITPYTIVALCGQAGSGKGYFAKKRIYSPLTKHGIPCKIYSNSIEVENILHENLTFPANILVGMIFAETREGLEEIIATCKEFHFQLIILKMSKDFPLPLSLYPNTYEIDLSKETIQDSYKVSYERSTAVLKVLDDAKCCVVGDVHGSWMAFQQMLTDDKGIVIDKKTQKIVITDPAKYTKHILVGDYIDKGSYKGIRKMIEFLYDNLEHFEICVGNHEFWVYKYLKGAIKPSAANTRLIGEWFTTVVLLLQDEVLREKFFHIYNHSYHIIETPLAIVTHAPCRTKYLRKEDEVSMKFMRNLKMNRDEEFTTEEEMLEARNNFFQFILDEADQLRKYHIFGHTMIPELFQYKNKICLDTGCVVGGKLSVALFNEEGELSFKKYNNPNPEKLELLMPYFSFDYTNYKKIEDGRNGDVRISDNEEGA